MHAYLRKFALSLPNSFAALCAIFFFGFFSYYLIGDLYVWGKTQSSEADLVLNIILFGTILGSLAVASLAATRAVQERPFGKALRDGAIWTASLFLAFILLAGIARIATFELSGPHEPGEAAGPFNHLFTSYEGISDEKKVFGCSEELLFGLKPWFCGDLLRALADGAIIGAFFFGFSKAIHNALPEKMIPTAIKPTEKTKRRNKPKKRLKG